MVSLRKSSHCPSSPLCTFSGKGDDRDLSGVEQTGMSAQLCKEKEAPPAPSARQKKERCLPHMRAAATDLTADEHAERSARESLLGDLNKALRRQGREHLDEEEWKIFYAWTEKEHRIAPIDHTADAYLHAYCDWLPSLDGLAFGLERCMRKWNEGHDIELRRPSSPNDVFSLALEGLSVDDECLLPLDTDDDRHLY